MALVSLQSTNIQPELTLTQDQDFLAADPRLLEKINLDLLKLYKECFVLAKGEVSNTEAGFQDRITQVRKDLRSYLKLVSVELYVRVRHSLKNDPRMSEFLLFEAGTRSIFSKIVDELNSLDGHIALEEFPFNELYTISRLVMERFQEEKAYLHPLYREITG